jgi:response regulator RpfG family c-di-GMP phosphodiesterase
MVTVPSKKYLLDLNSELQNQNTKLQVELHTTLKIFSSFIDLRFGASAGHGKRVARLSRLAAVQLNLPIEDCQQIFYAGLLHSLGKLAMPDSLIVKRPSDMTESQLKLWQTHPILAEDMLMSLEILKPAATIVRFHQERFDGQGFPDGLKGDEIPLGSRILAAAAQKCRLQFGFGLDRPLSFSEIIDNLESKIGKQLCPIATESVIAAIPLQDNEIGVDLETGEQFRNKLVRLDDIKPGDELAHDLVGLNGLLLMGSRMNLTDSVIERLRNYERVHQHKLDIWIRE